MFSRFFGALTEYVEPSWRSLDMRVLHVDEAYLVTHSYYGQESYLYLLSDACYTCPYERIKRISANTLERSVHKLDVTQPVSIKFFESDMGQYAPSNASALCTTHSESLLQEFGVYNITLNANGSCELKVDKVGVNVDYPLFVVLILLATALLMYGCLRSALQRRVPTTAVDALRLPEPQAQSPRVLSLDTFRGLAIVLMIFVNSGAGKYWWLEHATWNGLHPADVVFPAFLWIMGACIPISVRSAINMGQSRCTISQHILSRSIKLFLLGICLNSMNGPTFAQLRLMGVLQRFGIAYLCCGTLCALVHTNAAFIPRNKLQCLAQDLLVCRRQLIAALALTAVYLGVAFGLPVPGCPTGYFGPGGKHANAAYGNCTGGASGYIDRLVLGESHLYQHSTANHFYATPVAFDPEGLFGSVLTIVQVILGMLAGSMLLTPYDGLARVKRWCCLSLTLVIVGGVLSGFNSETGLIPVNKNLWSLSFVILTTGIAFSLFAGLYWLVDIRKNWRGHPFAKCGKNAIALYVGHMVLHRALPWHWRIGTMNTHFLLLLESTWNTGIWVAIALYMDARKIYITL